MEHNIAFCVLTYNHPDTIDEVLNITLKMYNKYGIDIYIYDSSENDASEKVVKKYINAGNQNLFYIGYEPNVNADDKGLDILSGHGLKKEYAYIFEVKDRAYFDEVTIKKIHEASLEGYDVILLPVIHWPFDPRPQPRTEVYTNALDFFRDYGKMVPNLETTVIRWDTILKQFDKNEFERRYRENLVEGFNHFNILFEQLLKVPSLKVKVLREEEVMRYNSFHSDSTWKNEIFEVWITFWSRAVDMLPSYYDSCKALVKKEETMQPVLFGSVHNLMRLIKNDLLTQSVVDEYRDMWSDVSDIPIECVEYLVHGKHDKAIYILFEKWIECFKNQEINDAYHMFYANDWLEVVLGKYNYKVLNKCFEVYRIELENGALSTIFDNIHTYTEAIEKYQMMKYLLRRLEYDCADEIINDIVPFFYEQKLSIQCLSYIICNECIDQEKVIMCWKILSEGYNRGHENE